MTYPTPRPTMEGWIGSLAISGKAKFALIDLIAGVRNGNLNRAQQAEIRLEKTTAGWTEQQPSPINRNAIASAIREAISDLKSIGDAYDGEDMCDVPTVAQYRCAALMGVLEELEGVG